MEESEEKLIQKIIKLEKAHNSLKIDEEKQKYEKEIKEAQKIIEKTKAEISKLSSKLDDLNNKNENKNSDNEGHIDKKRNELNLKSYQNEMKKKHLEMLMQNKSNFNNQEYILEVIKYWTPQKMFKYVQSYRAFTFKTLFSKKIIC